MASQQKKIIGVMWVGAIAAVVGLWLTRRGPADIEPAIAAPGTPVHLEESERQSPSEAPMPEAGQMPSQFRGDAHHSGVSPYTGPADGELAWRFETDGRITAQAVADGRGRIYVGSHDHFFYALDRSGGLRWRKDLGGRIYSTAALDPRGNIYVGSDAGSVWSFTPSGDQRWRLDVEADADTGIAIDSTQVVFAAGQAVWSVAHDGRVRWRREVNGKVFAAPVLDGSGNVFVGCQDDHFYSFSPEGEVRWSYRTGDDNDSSPVLDEEGNLYFGSDDHHVYALDINGGLKWSTDLDGMVRAPPSLGPHGSLLVGVFGPRPRVVALDRETGAERWYFPVTVADTTEIGVASGPLVDADGAIYFGAHDDYVYSLAPTGELRWAFQVSGDVDASPILLPSGRLVVGSDDTYLYAIGR